MKFVADFHIHSKYSRATSKKMDLEHLSKFANFKGIDLIGTGDFTHHLWLEELKNKLKPAGDGIFSYEDTHFILTAEVSNVYSKNGQVRKIHNLILSPSFKAVDKIINKLEDYGNLTSDGRPTLSLDSEKLFELVKEVDEDCNIVPCHIWTPWFSLFGANSGFDLLEECYGNYSDQILALETGLSSDPAMNWKWSKLDDYSLISNSDAHSPSKIGREANVFDGKIDYYWIQEALKNKDEDKFLYTIEFFPQEGKYHYNGHRNCGVVLSPEKTKELDGKCPECGRPLTIGVMHRVKRLSDRPDGVIPQDSIPFKHLIPLVEVISEVKDVGVKTKTVQKEYKKIIQLGENEFNVLLNLSFEDLKQVGGEKIANSIMNIREENVNISPGFDGEYGKIGFSSGESRKAEQYTLF